MAFSPAVVFLLCGSPFLVLPYYICFGRWGCLPRKSCMGRLKLLIWCRRLLLYCWNCSGVFCVKVPQRVWITCYGVVALHPCCGMCLWSSSVFLWHIKILLINGVGLCSTLHTKIWRSSVEDHLFSHFVKYLVWEEGLGLCAERVCVGLLPS